MPALTSQHQNALRTLLDKLSPNIALAIAEQINREVILEAADLRTIPVAQILMTAAPGLQTSFSLNAPRNIDSVLHFSEDATFVIVDLLLGGEGLQPPTTLADTHTELLQTAMSGVIRGLATALANLTGESVEVEACTSQFGPLTLPPTFAMSEEAVELHLPMTITDVLDTELVFVFTPEMAKALAPEEEVSAPPTPTSADVLSEDELAAMLSNMGGDIGGFSAQSSAPAAPAPSFVGAGASIPPPFANFPTSSSESTMPRGMELIMDIPLDVTVELGRVRMLIKDVLELSSGSIIELDRVAGEPVDLLVNGRLVAKGEVVVIEDNFGIRLTEIISPADRVAGLGKGR